MDYTPITGANSPNQENKNEKKNNNKSRRRQEEEETLSNSMENTDEQGLFQQNPPVNLLNPMTLSLSYPSSYMDAYYPPFENPNPFPVQSWDSNSQIEVIHPPGVEPPPTVTHISSACGTLPPYPTFTYLQNQAIASTSTPVHHYYHDPNVYPALPPIGIVSCFIFIFKNLNYSGDTSIFCFLVSLKWEKG